MNQLPFILLYSVSGFCFLTLEVIWARATSLALGSSPESLAWVLGAFFLSLAAGGATAWKLLGKTRNPLFLYAAAEGITGVSAAFLFWGKEVLLTAGDSLPPSVQAAVFVAGTVAIPSFFSGMTFPFLMRGFAQKKDGRASSAVFFYGGNLLGSSLGAVIGGFFLPRAIGFSWSFFSACAGLVAVAFSAFLLAFFFHPPSAKSSAEKKSRPQSSPVLPRSGWGIAALAYSGFASISLETLAMLHLQQFILSSIALTTAVLSIFVVGLGLGAFCAHLVRNEKNATETALLAALYCTAFCVLGYELFFSFALAGDWLTFTANFLSVPDAALAGIAAFPLPFIAGTVFPLAWRIVFPEEQNAARAFGNMFAINKIASAAGALAAPFLLVPIFGIYRSLLFIAFGYAVLATWGTRRPGKKIPVAAWGVPALFFVAFFGEWTRNPMPVSQEMKASLLAIYQGSSGVVSVVEGTSRRLVVNQRTTLNGTERALRSQLHQSWVPLFLCQDPKRVLHIGFASGISAAAALRLPIGESVSAEVNPAVIEAAKKHFSPWNHALFSDPRSRYFPSDGRKVLRDQSAPFDLILCDLFFPQQAETSNLYSKNFFSEASGKLRENGLFVLWLPAYQMTDPLAGIIVKTFLEVFPNAILIRGNFDPLRPVVGLVGSRLPIDLSESFLQKQAASPAFQNLAAESPFFRSPANFRLLFIGDLRAVAKQFDPYPTNTDDAPAFAFLAPEETKNGKKLIGNSLLEWSGSRFLDASFPSCHTGLSDPPRILSALRAGNYYFSASGAMEPLAGEAPENAERRMERAKKAFQYAEEIWPDADLVPQDLGR